MVSRTQAAFRLSAARLAARGKRLYFWTFTAHEAVSDKAFARSFDRFWRKVAYHLRRDALSWHTLRVFEPHLGGGSRNGRAHAHVICDFRWCVEQFRRCAKGTGIGRVMWVKRVRDAAGTAEYCSKYCSKTLGLAGVRRWAALSSRDEKGWHLKVGDVVADWSEAQEMRDLYAYHREIGTRRIARAVAEHYGIRRGFESTDSGVPAIDGTSEIRELIEEIRSHDASRTN